MQDLLLRVQILTSVVLGIQLLITYIQQSLANNLITLQAQKSP